jgi:hypothetical protein
MLERHRNDGAGHEATVLTSKELRVLAAMESDLRREDPQLHRSLVQRYRRFSLVTASGVVQVLTVALGVLIVSTGLVLASPWVGFAGFVMMVWAVHAVSWRLGPDVVPGLRRTLRMDRRP